MAKWYYAKGGVQQGPVDLMTLRGMLSRGEITPSDLVWRNGLDEWVEASASPEVSGPAAPIEYFSVVRTTASGSAAPDVYAGFWLRFGAWVLDWIILSAIGCCMPPAVFSASRGMSRGPLSRAEVTVRVINLAISWLYYALMESSATQATLGKMGAGIIVTDLEGERLTFGRATGRFFGRLLSVLTLFIGFMMAGWTERKQALHDKVAGTLVVRKR